MNEKEIYLATLQRYGFALQIDVAIEECAELIKVLCKVKRKQQGTPNADVTDTDVVGECVDVEIMLGQLRQIFSSYDLGLWDRIKKAKLQRMVQRLQGDELV